MVGLSEGKIVIRHTSIIISSYTTLALILNFNFPLPPPQFYFPLRPHEENKIVGGDRRKKEMKFRRRTRIKEEEIKVVL